jgi:acetyl-CoA acetyltransferase
VSAPGSRGAAAIAGVGYTPFTRASGRSVLDQATAACRAALDDAGLPTSSVDGIVTFQVMHDSVPAQAVATALALPGLRTSVDLDLGGQAPCHLVGLAAAAVQAGQARAVLVFRAMNGRSGPRVGTMRFAGPAAQYRYPLGYDAYLMYVAMWAQRFLHETGQGPEDLGAVAVAQRRWAVANERAVRTRPLELEAYLAAPYVVEPFRADDCTTEVDGACAVLVCDRSLARDLRHPPAVVAAAEYRAGPRSGLDIGDHLLWDDYSRNYVSLLAADLFGRAGVGPGDVDLAEIYDCFTSTVLIGLEGLGLAERGGSGALVRSGATAPGGRLPVNTHGGLLAEGYLHGMNTVCEAALQVQGRGGERQAPRHDVCVVTSGALMDGSAMVLTVDR